MHSIPKILETVAIAIVVFLVPLKAIVISVLILVLADMVSGILAAHKQNIPIESNKMKRTVSKLLLYYSAIIVAYIATTFLVSELIPIQKMVTTLIGVVEVKSILENLDIINGGDFFKSILDKLDRSNDN